MKQTETFEEWVELLVYTLIKCPDVRVEEVPDLIMSRQRELEQEPDVSIYMHGMTLPSDKDYEV